MGIEVAGCVGRAYSIRRAHGGFLPTSVIGGFGAAAAAARLRGLSPEQTAHTMGIWYAHCSGNRQALLDRTLTKRIQPGIAARAGVFAAYLAERGVTGPNRIIGNQPAALLSIYGTRRERNVVPMSEIMELRDYYEVQQISYKRFASCWESHPLLESVLAMVLEANLKLDEVAEIDVYGVRGGLVGTPWRDAENPHVLAQFCAPYQVASVIKNRRFGPAEITRERIAEDKEVDALARGIRSAGWDQWDGPELQETKGFQGVRITLKDGRVLHAVRNRDDALRPDLMPWEKIVDKFEYNAVFSGLVDEAGAQQSVRAVERLDECESIHAFVDKHLVFTR
jgi:2-methylcitrate dehydratase PrpD